MSDDKKSAPKNDARLGTGAAESARKDLRAMPAYRDYQMLKMSNGEKPVTYEEWKAGKR
jgi:hypothetical protein